jgi:hypothetical protein
MSTLCFHFKFILFVTGKGEKEHLPKMFRSLEKSGICSFDVKEFLGQRRPITAPKRRAEMVKTGKKIPDKDFDQIGAPARRELRANHCARVILIDDLEESGRAQAAEIFLRYRNALDSALGTEKNRASVHFLVNMLEAYFFAHIDALNSALAITPPIEPIDGDVESIPHPKGELKKQFPAYREIEHPAQILDLIDLDIVLGNADYCASLRTCVKWIVAQCKEYPEQEYFTSLNFEKRFHLRTGQLYAVTDNQ